MHTPRITTLDLRSPEERHQAELDKAGLWTDWDAIFPHVVITVVADNEEWRKEMQAWQTWWSR